MANGITIIAQVVLGGFFGGLVFALIRDLIWRRLTRPKLSFTDSYTTDFETNDDGEITKQVFRIPVKNTGQSAATNCKPELTMEGRLNDQVYEVDQRLTWDERGDPQRITINTDECAEIGLLRVFSEEDEGPIQTSPTFYIELPGRDGWGSDDSVTIWEYEDGRAVDASAPNRIERSQFTRIDWETVKITVTAENADKLTGAIKFETDTERGMMGMNVRVRF